MTPFVGKRQPYGRGMCCRQSTETSFRFSIPVKMPSFTVLTYPNSDPEKRFLWYICAPLNRVGQ